MCIQLVRRFEYFLIGNHIAHSPACHGSTFGKTIYRNEAGEEIQVNDGNTFFQICPIDANVKITAKEVTEPEPAE